MTYQIIHQANIDIPGGGSTILWEQYWDQTAESLDGPFILGSHADAESDVLDITSTGTFKTVLISGGVSSSTGDTTEDFYNKYQLAGTISYGLADVATGTVSSYEEVNLSSVIYEQQIGDTSRLNEAGSISCRLNLPQPPDAPEGYYYKTAQLFWEQSTLIVSLSDPAVNFLRIDTTTPTLSQLATAPLPYYQESATDITLAEVINLPNESYRMAVVWKRAYGDTTWLLYRVFDTPSSSHAITFYAPLPYGGGSEYWLDVEYNIIAIYSGRKLIIDNRAIWDGSAYIGGPVVAGAESGTTENLEGDPAGYDPATDTDPATSTRPGAYSKTLSSAVPFYTHTYTTYIDTATGAETHDHSLEGPYVTYTTGGIPDPGTTTTVTIIPAPPGTTVTEDPDTGLPIVTVTQPPIPYPEDTGDSGEKEVISPTDGSVKDPGVVTPVTDSVPLTAADYIQGIPGYPTNYFVSVGGTDVVAFAYNVTESQILSRVFRILGVTQEGQQPSAAQISCAREALGALIRSFQDRGVHFWTTAWMYVALSTTPSSVLGTDGKYYRCINSHISDADNRPITGKNWTSHWLETETATTTVWTAATTYYSNNMVVDATLDDLEQAFLRDANGYDTTLELVDAKAWGELSNKNEIGRPTKIWLNRTLTRTMQLWPIPDLTTYVLHYRRIRYLNDFTAVTGTGDFPQSWIDAIIFHLAHRLSFEYGNPIQEREELKMTALELEAVARGYNHERPTSNRLASCY